MSASPVRTIARQAGLWCSLVLVVVLCSLLFSLLGTLCTAVVAGTIMGAARRWKWQTIPVSVIFPLAGLTLAQAAKADLDARQRFIAAAVSFGAFWGTYFLTMVILLMERKEDAAPPSPDRNTRATDDASPVRERNRWLTADERRARETAFAAETFSLRDLQGTWLCEANGAEGDTVKRRLEIAEETFALNVTTATTGARLVARGAIKLEGVDGARRLSLSSMPEHEPNYFI